MLTLAAGMIVKLRSGLARLRDGLAGHTYTTGDAGGPTWLHLRIAKALVSVLSRLHLRFAEMLVGRTPGLGLRGTILRSICQSNRSGSQNCDGCKNVFHITI